MATDGAAGAGRGADGQDLIGGFGERSFASYRTLLLDPRYRGFFLATLVSSLGDWVGLFAILALTESIVGGGQASRATAFAFSGVMIARILPIMVMGPVAGVYVDRWDRKRTLVACDIGRGLVMALLAFSQNFLQLFLASFVVEVMSMLFAPAKEATLPNLVERRRLVHANQLTLTVTYGTLPLGGVILAVLTSFAALFPENAFLSQRPAAIAVWGNALTFFASATLFSRIDIPRNGMERAASASETPGAWQELIEGFRFIARRHRIRALIAGVMTAAFAGGALFTIAKLFVSVLGRGDTAFGLLVAATGVGMLMGLVASAPASNRFGEDRVFGPGIAIGGLFMIVVGFMPTVATASIGAFLMGTGAGLAFVTGYTMLQQRTDDQVRGRAFAAFHTGVRVAIFASLVLAPAFVGVLGIEPAGAYRIGGVRITIIASGVIALVGAVWSVRQMERAKEGGLGLGARSVDAASRAGLFVTFEGGEGAGKSTQMRLLRATIERTGRRVVTTREPGGTDLGERIRDLLLDPHGQLSERTEALLYAAARAQHADEVIRPALEDGAVVLSDRYVDSSVAYQGSGRGLGEESVEELNLWGTGGLVPDLVVLLDIDAAEGLQRSEATHESGQEPDRLEVEGLDFHRRVNEAFRRRAGADPVRFLVVDAARDPEEIHADVADAVLDLLEGSGTDTDSADENRGTDTTALEEVDTTVIKETP